MRKGATFRLSKLLVKGKWVKNKKNTHVAPKAQSKVLTKRGVNTYNNDSLDR